MALFEGEGLRYLLRDIWIEIAKYLYASGFP